MDLSELYSLQFLMLAELALGYFLRKSKFVTSEGGKTLSKLVVNVFLPCETVIAFDKKLDSSTLSACLHVLVISILLQVFCILLGAVAYRGQEDSKKTVLKYGTVCSNAGVLGNSIAGSLYGDTGLLYGSIYLIPVRIVMWTAGISYFTKSTDIKSVIKKVLTHPCIIAVEIGVVLMLTGFTLPTPVSNTLSSLGNAVMPLTMIFLGITLADSGFHDMVSRTTIYYSVIRLVIIPLAVMAGCALMKVESTAAAVSVILAAMPMGSSAALLAAQYDGDVSFATHCIVLTTLLSLAVLPAWMWGLSLVFPS